MGKEATASRGFATHSRVLSSFASLPTLNGELSQSLQIVGTLRCCYTERFAATIFSATPRCNIAPILLCCAKNRRRESFRVISPLSNENADVPGVTNGNQKFKFSLFKMI